MPTTHTQRMAAIADQLFDAGCYTMAASVDAITKERDMLLDLLLGTWDNLQALAESEQRIVRDDIRHADAITLEVPPGYDTVLGFLAKYHPDVLDDVNYRDPKVTQRDGCWLMHRCRKLGLDPIKVEAPACLKDVGIALVNAWPLKVLDERWGA